MNDRDRAISILRRARDILAGRLTDRVIDSQEEILDDAVGDSYLGEISTLYDELGTRLAHVNQLLAAMPQAVDEPLGSDGSAVEYVDGISQFESLPAPKAQPGDETPPADSANDRGLAETSGRLGGEEAAPGAVAPPSPNHNATSADAADRVTARQFTVRIQSGDVEAAGRSLARLFQLDAAHGRELAGVFRDRLEDEPALLHKMLGLRAEVGCGHFNSALASLYECFNMQGLEALAVLQVLRDRYGPRGD